MQEIVNEGGLNGKEDTQYLNRDIMEEETEAALCLFIILLVQFGLLSGHLLGNSCPLG